MNVYDTYLELLRTIVLLGFTNQLITGGAHIVGLWTYSYLPIAYMSPKIIQT